MPRVVRRLSSVLLLAGPVSLAAQNAPQSPPRCDAPEFRQFDFWVGDWVVENPAGQPIGASRIERILDGCVILEHWNEGQPGSGKSFNIWNRQTRRWHQTWVAIGGNLLLLDGGFENGAMVLGNEQETPRGRVRNRITWRQLEGGVVQQLWEISSDDGRTWQTSFDGRYRRRP